jgi:hypothetical protein
VKMQIRMQRHATGSRLPSDAILRCNKQRLSGLRVSSSECESLVMLGGENRSGTVWYTNMFQRDMPCRSSGSTPKTAGISDKLHGVTFQNTVILTSQLLRSLRASLGMWQHKDDLGRRYGK